MLKSWFHGYLGDLHIHIGKKIFQKVNKIFVKVNMLVFMEDIQLILKTVISI